MTVTFFKQRPEGSQKIGTITLRDGVLVADPADSIALINILAGPLEVYHEDRPPTLIDPIAEPEAFLKALPREYGHGSYFFAGTVED